MSGNHHLYVPGPSNVPAAVQQAIHCPMEDHRNPTIPELIAPLIYSIPLQLLAYHVAILKGTDIDQPRNLAKSVTVE